MKTTISEYPDLKITLEIDDKRYNYVDKKRITDSLKSFYDEINYAVCHSDPNNNIPIEQALMKKNVVEKNELAKTIFFDAPYIYKTGPIETKIDGKYMEFNRDDCIAAVYNSAEISVLTKNAISILYKEKLFGKLQTNFEDIKTTEKCRAIVALVEDAYDEYWDECNRGKAAFMISALKNLDDFNQVNVAFAAISFIKPSFVIENDSKMCSTINEVESVLYSKLMKDAKVEVISSKGCKVSVASSGIFDTKIKNTSCKTNEEDDDEEFL